MPKKSRESRCGNCPAGGKRVTFALERRDETIESAIDNWGRTRRYCVITLVRSLRPLAAAIGGACLIALAHGHHAALAAIRPHGTPSAAASAQAWAHPPGSLAIRPRP